jgi:hypothetical protein
VLKPVILSAVRRSNAAADESKDPENVYRAMLSQGVLASLAANLANESEIKRSNVPIRAFRVHSRLKHLRFIIPGDFCQSWQFLAIALGVLLAVCGDRLSCEWPGSNSRRFLAILAILAIAFWSITFAPPKIRRRN